MAGVYLNGRFVPAAEASVSVHDRGFLFGDAVYEVIPVYARRAFRLEAHLARLACSLQSAAIEAPPVHWTKVLPRLLEDVGDGEHSIYIQITRGVGRDRDAAVFDGLQPTVFASVSPVHVDRTLLRAGIRVALLEDIRWQHCEIKTTSLLGNLLLRRQAQHLGAAEALIHRDGEITEGSSSNAFFVLGGELFTAVADRRILRGITRDVVIELAAQCGIALHQQALPLEKLAHASEAFICSSVREVVPVTHIDDRKVGDGKDHFLVAPEERRQGPS